MLETTNRKSAIRMLKTLLDDWRSVKKAIYAFLLQKKIRNAIGAAL